ncbi:RHS repeat domain-containing protein [Kribbella catacumbae]|uniref:RHS repeat domain-containing protein n=1 Tax=Kribbella catacumbae TaxID=460086 RepID=UPI00146D1C9B|nr:RHS repeat-associated core domain-containing protein [Kribbella catacumbae]
MRAGSLPVYVGRVQAGRTSSSVADGPSRLRVQLLDRAAAKRAGVEGLLLRLSRTDGITSAGTVSVEVDYSAFRNAYGADWAGRLRLVAIGNDGVRTPVWTRNDVESGRVTADVPASAAGYTLALTAGAEGSTGDYKATSLSPAGTWQVSAQTGGFSWGYNLRTPPVPGGLAPDLSASYASSGVDGRIASTNNQTSWAGEGWNLWPGFVERSYKTCADDLGGNNGQTKTGDLCWETDNATMSFAGRSSRLVSTGNRTWRPEKDDGTRVEQLLGAANGDKDGEYWKITTTDGTQYYFGRNRLPGWVEGKPETGSAWTVPVFGNDLLEPCNAASFAASSCAQAYRWNLDHVVDAHGNSMTYYYAPETNKYGLNRATSTASYTRGGTLDRIEYGTREGSEYGSSAPAKVTFQSADRCVAGANCAVRTPAAWPDVPWDQDCAGTTCPNTYSPTFWSTKRLAKITTEVRTGATSYKPVESWTFAHSYPAPGDGTTPSLWLSGITHSAGALTLPAVTFDGTAKANRVDAATDGLPSMNKYRIHAVNTESGGVINVEYAAPDCVAGALPAPDLNTKRCFPVRWAMPPSVTPVNDWFHLYVVASLNEVDRVGGGRTQITGYQYVGGAAWAHDDDPLVATDKQTWNQWRGYEKVLVRKGDPGGEPDKPQSETQYQYFRGMHGDKLAAGGTRSATVTDSMGTALADEEPLAGFLREEITRDGKDGAVVSGRIGTPSQRLTATQGTLKAYQVETAKNTDRTALAAGGFRTTEVETIHDEHGNATQMKDKGDVNVTGDEQCTTTSYVKNTVRWLVALPSHTRTVGVACGATPSYPADAIADIRTSYDGGGVGVAPQKGDVTTTEVAKSYSGSTPIYSITARAAYDVLGRELESSDALGRTTTKSSTELNGLTTTTVVTNPLGHSTTTTLDPAWGQPTAVLDANQRRTDLTYDALGRVTAVWTPGRSKAIGDGPNQRYSYGLRADAPTWVKTEALTANGAYLSSYALKDGFLRPRQTQEPSPAGGRVLTDTTYDSRGLATVKRNAYYNNDSGPAATLFAPQDNQVPAATRTDFDGAGRPTASVYLKLNVEQWRTTTEYGGDRVKVTPPNGATPTTTVTDARGRTTQLQQHKAGGADTTSYGHTKAGLLATVTDPAGNILRSEYDVLGREVRSLDPDRGETNLTYDAAGQLLTTTDARGKTVAAIYDAGGRRVETRLGSTTGTLLGSWTYDRLPDGTSVKGAVVSSTRYTAGKPYTKTVTAVDPAGRPTTETVTIPEGEKGIAGSYTSTTTYRVNGSPSAVGLPKLGDLPAETLVYGYNALGLPETVTGAAKYITATNYTAFSEKAQVEFGAGGKRVWQTSYYEEGTRRLAQQLTERELAGNVLAGNVNYSYDPAGNVTKIADTVAGSAVDTQCFRYDYLRRVTSAWTATDDCAAAPSDSVVGGPAPYWQTFAYDLTGNRISHTENGLGTAADTVRSYGYPSAKTAKPHALRTVKTTGAATTTSAYGYDPAGNLITRPGPSGPQTLRWSDDGTLGSVISGTDGTEITSYVYDANGAQLIRRDPGTVTLFVGAGELTYDTATGTAKGTRYYEGVGVRTKAGVAWLAADRHGTAELAIDSTTLAVTARRTDLFGNVRGEPAAWTGGNRGFVGGMTNNGTGLTRLGVREYDPALGRFVSPDPLTDPGDPQQLNAYAYASNNPATLSDPSGLRADYDDCRCNYNGNPPPVYGPHLHEVCHLFCQIKKNTQKYKAPRTWRPPMALPKSTWQEFQDAKKKELQRQIAWSKRREQEKLAEERWRLADQRRRAAAGPDFWDVAGVVLDVGLTVAACAGTAGAGCVARGLLFVAATTVAANAPTGAGAAAAAGPNFRVEWPEGYGPVDLSKTNAVVRMPRETPSFTMDMTLKYKYDVHSPEIFDVAKYDAKGALYESRGSKVKAAGALFFRLFGRIAG